jgi:predicted phage terminase large subunit-like protein
MMIRISPQKGPQEEFLSSSADIVIYGGSAGGGKSYGLLLEPLRHIKTRGFGAVIFRRTFTQIRNIGGLWDTSEDIYLAGGGVPKESILSWDFKPYNTSIKFAHLEHEKNKYDYQGAQITLIEFDELTQFSESQFFYLMSRNRSVCGIKPYIRATTNPDASSWVATLIDWWIGEDGYPILKRSGVIRWFIRINDEMVWGNTKEELILNYPDTIPKSFTFISAKLEDNKILEQKDPGYRGVLMALQMVERERLLGGNWKILPSAGMYYRREWFEIVDKAPKGEAVRYWDTAATEPTASNKDPDWTAGLKLVESGNTTYVVDLRHVQKKSAGVEELIKHTASVDGVDTKIVMEQEPGGSGKMVIDHYAILLKGYSFHGVLSTKAKEIRAGPSSAAAENGLVKLVRGDWNTAFLDELEAFPEGAHDDIVDAFSGAFNVLDIKQRQIKSIPTSVGGYVNGRLRA